MSISARVCETIVFLEATVHTRAAAMSTVHLLFEESAVLAERVIADRCLWDAPAVVLLRGMPGSGKTAFAHELAFLLRRASLRVKICARDDYLWAENTPQPTYVRRVEWLRPADDACYAKFLRAVSRRTDVVIVNNPNLWDNYVHHYIHQTERCYVVAFSCPSLDQAHFFHNRSTRGLLWGTVEENWRAYYFTNIEPDFVVRTPVDRQ
jgi:hypothetical protein